MKKNVLNEAIAELGIEDGDVVKVKTKCKQFFTYQYLDGKFQYINGDGQYGLSNNEVFDLITGGEFEIIAKGKESRTNEFLHLHNKISCLEDEVVDAKLKIQSISCDTTFLKLATIEDKAKKDEKKKIAKWVDLGAIVFWGVFLLVTMILAACGVL